MAIVAMVNNTKPVELGKDHSGLANISALHPDHEEVCVHLKPPNTNHTVEPDDQGEFHWDAVEQGIILGSFFWGYGNSKTLFA